MYRLSLISLVLLVVHPILAQSPHGDELAIDCAKCHNPQAWTVEPNTIEFQHDLTDFQLEGTHAQTDCKLCHSTLVFNEAPSQCLACHADVHSMSVGNDCVRCHTAQTWLVDNIPELHEENGFPLMAAHAVSSCYECHAFEADLIFNRIGNECVSCHRQDFESSQNPNHVNAGFSTNCIDCHSPLGFDWGTEAINHGFFPLTAAHDIQDCAQCHTTGNFSDASPECVSCHQADFASTQNPNHQATGFSTDCVSCHTTDPGWTPAVINHDFFPLNAGHDIQDCAQCHTTSNYADASPECVSCHQADFASTQNPNHQATGFSTDCVSCHTTDPGWTTAVINHDFFPLNAGHDIQDCAQCHTTGNYADASPECVSCHQADFASTQNPNHQATGFSTDCVTCHTTDPGWTPAVINHDFFPLNAGHDIQDCAQCHTTGNYADASPECVSCHQADFASTQNPNHQATGFSTDCVSCHTTDPGWMPAVINHDFFPLNAGHDIQDCAQCHTTGNYADASPECVSCHQADFASTQNPNHQATGFSTDCVSCHTTDPGWTPAVIDHDFFPLNAGHDIQDCAQCHTTSNYADASPECVSCHQADFASTQNPNHQVTGFSTDCVSCHTTDPGWTPAVINHDFFPLNAGHDIQDCAQCHTTSNYADASPECVSCHQNNYDQTTDPNHLAAQFPTDCASCHTTNPGWTPADFDHDGQYFRIYSGTHQGEWNDCATCHTNPSNYSQFSCFECHTKTETDNDHSEENDYLYNSNACLQCHPS